NAAQLKNIEMVFMGADQEIWDMVNEGSPYFYVELPDGTRMAALNVRNFPLQFAREVLATRALLNCEEKVDWRNCELAKDEQIMLVKKLQHSFKPFDFTDNDSDSE
uniref:Cwf19-like protein C-terminal domain-containing protein n=1 Tax=Parascaris univalens TaxID=6257 RepID=A0A915B5N8_PARUN